MSCKVCRPISTLNKIYKSAGRVHGNSVAQCTAHDCSRAQTVGTHRPPLQTRPFIFVRFFLDLATFPNPATAPLPKSTCTRRRFFCCHPSAADLCIQFTRTASCRRRNGGCPRRAGVHYAASGGLELGKTRRESTNRSKRARPRIAQPTWPRARVAPAATQRPESNPGPHQAATPGRLAKRRPGPR